MEMELDDFVCQQNLELYRKLLAESAADDPRRTMLQKLIAEEKARQTAGAKTRISGN
jgi:cytochrome c-type biogenesis protein CcmH/NrfG